MLAGLIGALGGAAVIMFSLPATLFGRVPHLTGQVEADAPLVAVVDGQTLRLREAVVRLQGVAAPPRGASCRLPSGAGFDCGAAATEALADLVRGHAVTCQLDGRDAEGFPQGRCEAGGIDLNHAVIAAGWARSEDGGPDLAASEAAARAGSLGIWRMTGAASF